MTLDPRIILSGNSPNVFGNFVAGQQAGFQAAEAQRQNALAAAMQEHGAGLVRGDEAAINALAGFDPTLVMGVQNQQSQMADRDRRFGLSEEAHRAQMSDMQARLELAYAQAGRQAQELGMKMDGAQRSQLRDQFDQTVAMLTAADTPEKFEAIMSMPGARAAVEQFVGPGMDSFENLNVIVAAALGAKDALDLNRPAGFRQATPEEAAQYGAQAGQFGPDGRFYPVNPPSGMTLRQTGDGFEFVQGPGAGAPGAGTVPQGYRRVVDESDPQGWRIEPIPGGPVAQQQQAEAEQAEMRQEQAQRYANVVLDDIGRVRDIVQRHPNLTTGMAGNFTSAIPATPAHDVAQLLQTIRSNVGFDRLQQMRAASPTGGALGAVSDFENRQLQSTLGNLEQSQTLEQFMRNLDRLEQVYNEIVHGPQAAQSGAGDVPPIPSSLPQEYHDLWQHMTPEDRALWQN